MADDKDYEKTKCLLETPGGVVEIGLDGKIMAPWKADEPQPEKPCLTVAGLIEELKKFPPEAQVVIEDYEYCEPYELHAGEARILGEGEQHSKPLSVVLNG